MITAGSAAALCRSEQDFLLCALQAAGELLEVSCVIFYPAAGSPFGHIGTLRVNQRAGNDLETPESLPTMFSDYLRRDLENKSSTRLLPLQKTAQIAVADIDRLSCDLVGRLTGHRVYSA